MEMTQTTQNQLIEKARVIAAEADLLHAQGKHRRARVKEAEVNRTWARIAAMDKQNGA